MTDTAESPVPTDQLVTPPEADELPLHVPIPNYTLSSVCPNCDAPVIRFACKVRCERCGFMWDCAEL